MCRVAVELRALPTPILRSLSTDRNTLEAAAAVSTERCDTCGTSDNAHNTAAAHKRIRHAQSVGHISDRVRRCGMCVWR